ncbi:response regulator [Candidatus Roizmanbacteria bacterium]|nr:MAG: response regulator [Candidatus Roizmanbacteria bacterium]
MYILLADDDTFFQKFYQSQLTAKGYEVSVAVDGTDAMAKLHEKKPDILILDLIMPQKDGFEVLTEMSQEPSLKNIPVLIFSTLGQEKDVQHAMELGAKGYVNKSFFDFDALVAKIEQVSKL